MYSEDDIDGAVAAGVLDPGTAAAFRRHVANTRSAPAADEEQFRLLTGFNDIFVALAVALVLAAVGKLVGGAAGALGVAACSWLLSEYFTRRRRMALPSILLHVTFVAGIGFAAVRLAAGLELATAFAGAAAAGAASWVHWRRFRVPVSVALMLGALVAAVVAGALAQWPLLRGHLGWLAFAAGLVLFAAAMYWDASDTLRQTRRSDVAFWLHLLAAPLLVHSLFALADAVTRPGAGHTAVVLGGYLLLTVVSLVVDRRSLMVSALVYVLYALSSLLEGLRVVQSSAAVTALVIGSALLLLSAMWGQARRPLVGLLPTAWRARVPPAA